MIPVIVIGLKRSPERRSLIQTSLDGLGVPFQFYDAIDGKMMSPLEIAALAPQPYDGQHGRPLNSGEIGCAESYGATLQKIEAGKMNSYA